MKIKEMRESKGMTQFELSVCLNVCRSSVAMWETGQSTPRPEVLIKLSELFNCTVDELLKGE